MLGPRNKNKRVCGRCGQLGHVKTNKICRLYGQSTPATEGGGRRAPATVHALVGVFMRDIPPVRVLYRASLSLTWPGCSSCHALTLRPHVPGSTGSAILI